MTLVAPSTTLALYLHWPFCILKCPYCDFNSHVRESISHGEWEKAYLTALKTISEQAPHRKLTSIFFGGGTPSLMMPSTIENVLKEAEKRFGFVEDIEITLEANPSSVEAGKFKEFKEAGINRLSIGVQSFQDKNLKFLGRAHDAKRARETIAEAHKVFDRFSFDLMYGLPNQTWSTWETELEEALSYCKGHLSLYQLTLEKGTAFYSLAQKGSVLTCSDELSLTLFTETQKWMESRGYPAYEISNHAVAGQESRHNLTYWYYDDYIGIGPGAHGRYVLKGKRYATESFPQPEGWLKLINEDGLGYKIQEELSPSIARKEALMMGLRLQKGISFENWEMKFGSRLQDDLPQLKIDRLVSEGYLLATNKHLKTSDEGRLRLNAILRYLEGE